MGNLIVSAGQTVAFYLYSLLTKRHKYYIIRSGNTQNVESKILKRLHERIPGLKQVCTVEECDVILVFCPIVSRAGTDMEAALNKLNNHSAFKPAVFMVLHHTYEQEKTVPDSSSFVNRENTLTLNLLFNEDYGLLKCDMNEKAVTKITEHIKPQIQFNFPIRSLVCLLGISTVFIYYIYRY